jgi:hypothetical protein
MVLVYSLQFTVYGLEVIGKRTLIPSLRGAGGDGDEE